jgi:hypothetical protein
MPNEEPPAPINGANKDGSFDQVTPTAGLSRVAAGNTSSA